MLAVYHRQIMMEALREVLRPVYLHLVCEANVRQDNLIGQLHSEYHFDNNRISEGFAYIAAQREQAVAAMASGSDKAWVAFGRALHAAQDFYAHTNYVNLWLEKHGGLEATSPGQIEPWQGELDDRLRSGFFNPILWILSRMPLLGGLLQRLPFYTYSHESMNLDHPGRGPAFEYALVAATKCTRREFEQLIRQAQALKTRTEIRHCLSRCLLPGVLEEMWPAQCCQDARPYAANDGVWSLSPARLGR